MGSDASPLRVEVIAPGVPPAAAFDLLVAELVSALPRSRARFVPGADGQISEVGPDGVERVFARVTDWEPGRRIRFDWFPVDLKQEIAPVSVEYTFEGLPDGTRLSVEYQGWTPSTPLDQGEERVGWFASGVLPLLIRATAPVGFGDWWTDRVARRPSGSASRQNYAEPMYHLPNFLVILERLHLTSEDRLLEVGCGGGAFLKRALASGCRAWAVDHSPEMVRLARDQNRAAVDERRLEIVEADAHHLPFPDALCTCAVTTGSFGFWERPVDGLREIRRVLQPGGRFVLFTGTRVLRGTPASSEPITSRVRDYEDDELAAVGREAGFIDVQVDRPDMARPARAAGLPPDAVAFFESLPGGGQILQARRGPK